MVDIRLPNITGATEQEKISQINRYLYQLTEQLNFALSSIEGTIQESVLPKKDTASAGVEDRKEEKAESNFNEIKSLIIKSADIVNSYYEEFKKKFNSEYVAVSDFGTYKETVKSEIVESTEGIQQSFSNVQTILDELQKSVRKIDVSAYIKSGKLDTTDEGTPIYGVEIGQSTTDESGTESFNRYARFTSNKLSFYNASDKEVAYISDFKLHIKYARVEQSLELGNFLISTDNGLAFKWIGGM